jgi:CheY-like chemotaxis protein
MSRILVVDDDPLQLDLYKQVLEFAGYDVEIAFTTRQALSSVKQGSADLIILDLRFPDAKGVPDAREGVGLIRHIRETGCRTPMIVLSGWPEDLAGRPEERMVSRVLLKPVRTPVLLHTALDLLS